MIKKTLVISLAISLYLFSFMANAEFDAAKVQKRIDTFDEIEQIFKALRFKIVNQRSTDAAGAKEMSSAMLDLAHELPPLFNAISSRQNFAFSRSKPEVWTKNTEFSQQLSTFIDNFEEIDELLEANNLPAAAKVIDRTAQGCRRCHNIFRYK